MSILSHRKKDDPFFTTPLMYVGQLLQGYKFLRVMFSRREIM